MRRRELAFDPIEIARYQWVERGWVDAAPGLAAITTAMRIQQIFVAWADDILKQFELNFARWEVLILLYFSKQNTAPLGKIGERLQVHPASITNTVNRLEKVRFVKRMSDPSDGRGVIAKLTPKGLQVVEEVTPILNRDLFKELGGLTREQLGEFFMLGRQIRRNAGDFLV